MFQILKSHIDSDHKVWILGDVGSLTMTSHHSFLLASTAAKENVYLKTGNLNNPHKHWINELVPYSTAEEILYSVRKKPKNYERRSS